MKTTQILAAIFTSALMTCATYGAIIETVNVEAINNVNGFHVGTIQGISGDLLETSVSSVNEGPAGDGGQQDTSSITDGLIKTGWNTPSGTWGSNDGAHFVEYNLDTSVYTLGYDIDEIGIIQHSGDVSNRPYMNVDIELGFVDDPSVALWSTGLEGGGTAWDVNQAIISDDSDGLLGSGVNRVKFTFPSSHPTSNNWTWYRELDVVGTATTAAVPEPSTFVLASLSLLGIACFGWRKRK